MPAAFAEIDTTRRHGTTTQDDWVLIATRQDLNIDRPLLPIMIDARPFILFQDDSGALGLIGRHCPHRGADLCFGRLEDNGIRCPFHGWHFDRTGQCVDQPAEPEGSQMHKAIKVPMIPLRESEGRIYAYVGDKPDDMGATQ